ncbi:hypothetical protein VW23_019750 [Devosia insulae DS-56]|uniref:histidine kinase n=1 Tax=Devosia insulae DS-56 TaxID=1116389 RepID=A0A1E5XQ42_9HYPH|nr:hypothetical protein VW23_019750 [Devosia insulae DS-56]
MLETLLDALLSALKADFVCVTLEGPKPKSRIRGRSGVTPAHDQLLRALAGTFGDDKSAWPPAGEISVGADAISILSAPMGLQGEVGVVVAGTRRRDFDDETGGLLLGAAANQAALALQAVRRLDEQKQIASDLDERVAQRTAELARANEALRFAARESREIVDNIPTLVGLLSPTGQVELVNRQIHEYTGRSTEELEKWGMSDLVHQDDLADALDSFVAGFAAGEPFEIVYRMRRHDGIYRWFEGLHHPLKDAEGRVVRWCVSCNDIEDRKQVEDALRERERTWRSVINGIPGLTATLSPRGMVEAVNRQIVEYTGCELEALRGWGSNGIVHPEDMPHVAEIFGKSIAAGASYEIEQRLRRFDGEYRWFSNRGTPAFDASGQVVRWYVLLVDIHEARLVADALRSSEDNARSIVSSIAGMIAVFTADGQLCGGNQQLLDFFEQPLEEVGRWATNGMTHPDDLQYCIDSFMGSIVSGEPYNYETRFKRADGVWRWFNIRGQPLRDASGQIARWYGLLTDIDDRKRAEEALEVSERNLQLTVDTIPALAWSARIDGTADFFNRHYLEYVGKTPEELGGWAWTAAVHPDDIARLGATWNLARETGGNAECEARLLGADGAYRWFIFRANPLLDDAGNVLKWYGINTDIEDRKRAEESLRLSEASLAEAQRLSSLGSFQWRLDTDELTFSDELYRIFEFDTAEPATLEQIAARVDPDDLPLLTEKMELARVGIDDHSYDIRLRMPDGRTKHLRSVSRSGTESDGRRVFRGTIQDVTQRKLSEEALNELRTELAHVSRVSTLGAMTASIAHEVNQPLAGIITNASTCLRMLAMDPPNIEGALETARRSIRDGNRAAEVITRLRAMFRKTTNTSETVDLNEAARDVIVLAGSELRRKRVELETNLASDLPPVMGDRVQLQQVILNLLLNAADAVTDIRDRPRRAMLKTSEDEDGNVRLTVQDNGGGIDPSSSTKLFDAFYTTKASGMGIGLSVSRSIIERHGGRIWASANDGPGASFSFAVPRSPKGYNGGDATAYSAHTQLRPQGEGQ